MMPKFEKKFLQVPSGQHSAKFSKKICNCFLHSLFQPRAAMSYGSLGNVGSFSNLLTYSDVVLHLDKTLLHINISTNIHIEIFKGL